MNWIGIDVAKKTFQAALILEASRGHQRQFERTPQGVTSLMAWLDEHNQIATSFVMEATGRYSIELAQWLRQARPTAIVSIVNPSQTAHFHKSLGLRNKTDQCDAYALALYGRERSPRPYEPISPELGQLRELMRQRQSLVETLVAEKNRLEEGSTSTVVVKLQKRHIAHLESGIASLQAEGRKIISRCSALGRDFALLQSIPGVGWLTAAVVLGELGDLRRFRTSRALAAFAGLSPRQFESGTSVQRPSRLCKRGPSAVRKILYMSAMASVRSTNSLADFYNHLLENSKPKMSALCAVMRKLLLVMRAVLATQTPYTSNCAKHIAQSGKPA